MTYRYRDHAVVDVAGPAERVFARLDDPARFGEHMEKPSMMMMGGRMSYELDAAGGRSVGSVIRMRGGFLGAPLYVEEVVTERSPPTRKVWETRDAPRLIVIGAYRMGFDITSVADRCRLDVFIEYDHPRSWLGRVLAAAFAPMYARWCIRRIAEDAQRASMA